MDSIERYLEVFEDIRRRKRWSTGINILRFAALTLASTDMADPGSGLEDTAKVLADKAGGFSPLGSGKDSHLPDRAHSRCRVRGGAPLGQGRSHATGHTRRGHPGCSVRRARGSCARLGESWV